MASKSSVAAHASYTSKLSIEDRMALVVKRVGEVKGLVRRSPLYWESIELLAKDEGSRGIFYALPDDCKLDYLKRKFMVKKREKRKLMVTKRELEESDSDDESDDESDYESE
ncbi:hypothetical protein EUTSA_v10017697mg [Eutrema salsugineum]|uniref:Uncharacterized protein n=1 Tax=Eutrema salsugineum TaxID=72664 RepID=V4M552_EUTSA|nr:uncharacterized protein LOC18027498 [Eutrema salsugineum]ESQ51374.1 hypothetical protein EUTSA_v10017697mg [Eutrema salsugineum]